MALQHSTENNTSLNIYLKPNRFNKNIEGHYKNLSNTKASANKQQLWLQVESYLQPWLKERQTLIQTWVATVSLAQNASYIEKNILDLCALLMDYISAGHFEIYEKLLEESKAFDDGFLSLAEPLYELIGHSTEQALRFNEAYASSRNCRLKKRRISFDLSKLGESLEQRFEAEDQLVKFLHQLHSSH